MKKTAAVLFLLLAATVGLADPPTVPATVEAALKEPTVFTVKASGGKKVGVAKTFDPKGLVLSRNWSDDPAVYEFQVFPKKPGDYRIAFWTEGETQAAVVTVTVPGAVPDPVQPDVKPVDPPVPVDPVTSFRVFLIYESGAVVTPAQKSVLYGADVEKWLTANCTGGAAGWGRRDKDSPPGDDPTMAALWQAVQAKVTTVPCIAVERNGKADILPLDGTPAAQVATLTKYRGK